MAAIRATYFPFADGALAYNCRVCGFRCCSQSGGFGLPREELDGLLALHPSVALFVQPSGHPDYFTFGGIGPRCFFLEAEGTCLVHRAHGWHHKPYICKTFPVNQFSLLGGVLVAGLHALCPIEPARGRRDDLVLRHDELLRGLEPYRELVASRARREPLALDARALDAALAHEAWCRDLPLRRPGLSLDRAAAILGQAAALYPELPPDALLDDPDLPVPAPEHRRYKALLDELLRAPPMAGAGAAAQITELLLLALPGARIQARALLPDHPQQNLVRAFPRMLLVLHRLVSLAAAASAEPLTFAAVREIARDNLALIWLLCQLDRVPRFAARPDGGATMTVPASQQAAVRRFVSFLHGDRRARDQTLWRCLDLAGPAGFLDRLLLLRSLPEELLAYLRFA